MQFPMPYKKGFAPKKEKINNTSPIHKSINQPPFDHKSHPSNSHKVFFASSDIEQLILHPCEVVMLSNA